MTQPRKSRAAANCRAVEMMHLTVSMIALPGALCGDLIALIGRLLDPDQPSPAVRRCPCNGAGCAGAGSDMRSLDIAATSSIRRRNGARRTIARVHRRVSRRLYLDLARRDGEPSDGQSRSALVYGTA